MFEIISREITTITPELAASWLLTNTFQSQRRLRPSHVNRLVQAITNNNFTTGNIAFARNILGTKLILMNGQHQLSAVVKTDRQITANVEIAVCPTQADAARYFSQFDVGAVRSIGDIVKAEADALNITWGRRISSLLVGAMEYISDDNTYKTPNASVTKFDRAGSLQKNMEEGHFLNNIFTGENARMLIRVPIAVAAIMNFHADKAAALTFWEGVKTGVNLSEKDPRRPLRDFLLSTPISVNRSKSHASPREITVRCIHTWNAWRRNDSRTMLAKYHHDVDVPKAI